MWCAHTCTPRYKPLLRFIRLYILLINHKFLSSECSFINQFVTKVSHRRLTLIILYYLLYDNKHTHTYVCYHVRIYNDNIDNTNNPQVPFKIRFLDSVTLYIA